MVEGASDFPQPIQRVGNGSHKMFCSSRLEEPLKNGDTSFLANHIEMCHFVRKLHNVAMKLHLNGVLKKSSFLTMCIGTKNKRKKCEWKCKEDGCVILDTCFWKFLSN